jgi:hypothetical protein
MAERNSFLIVKDSQRMNRRAGGEMKLELGSIFSIENYDAKYAKSQVTPPFDFRNKTSPISGIFILNPSIRP